VKQDVRVSHEVASLIESEVLKVSRITYSKGEEDWLLEVRNTTISEKTRL